MLASEIPSRSGLGFVSITVWHEVECSHIEEPIGFDGLSEGGGDSLSATWALGFVVEVYNNFGFHIGFFKASSAGSYCGGGEKNRLHIKFNK